MMMLLESWTLLLPVLTGAQLRCFTCSFTFNDAIFPAYLGPETVGCLNLSAPLGLRDHTFSRPCLPGTHFCQMEVMSLGWAMIGVRRDCGSTCFSGIEYSGYGLTNELKRRVCSGSNCNRWTAGEIWADNDWFDHDEVSAACSGA